MLLLSKSEGMAVSVGAPFPTPQPKPIAKGRFLGDLALRRVPPVVTLKEGIGFDRFA